MIVTEDDDRYRFVTQPDHARQAGQFARHWGNNAFDRPDPYASMSIAASIHDLGWSSRDCQPYRRDGAPEQFVDVTGTTWTSMYETAIDRTDAIDRYAATMVAMHGVGLRRQLYGTLSSMPATAAEYEAFIAEQEARQRERLSELAASSAPVDAADVEFFDELADDGTYDGDAADAPQLWTNYKLIEVWDRLSLYFCWNDPIDERTLGPVPIGYGQPDDGLRLEPTDRREARVRPYPFDVSPLVASVPVRYVRTDVDSERELIEAYYEADEERLECTLHR
ncbi:MAG: DUF3891 family protein [Haloarculaceae archaeon]